MDTDSYDLDDPKHPTYVERMLAQADDERAEVKPV